MEKNWVRAKLRNGEPTIGCFLGLGSPQVAELLAHAGYDWLILETEHSAVDIERVEHMMMAMGGSNALPFVRVATAEPIAIQRALDAGAMGIMVPMVRTADEAQAIVDNTRYPPSGKRGFGPLRASRYMNQAHDYFREANENILVSLILETKDALDRLDEITSVPGLDGIFVGPFDLCLSLGLDPFEQPHAEIEEWLERLVDLSRRHGVAAGIGCDSPEDLQRRRDQGFTFLAYGTDYSLLQNAARPGLDAFRQHG